MSKPKNKKMLTREQYKKIKKYDHNQMELYAQRLVENGITIGYEAAVKEFENSKNTSDGVDLKLLRFVIGGVKGIGEKKLEDIMKALEEANICTK